MPAISRTAAIREPFQVAQGSSGGDVAITTLQVPFNLLLPSRRQNQGWQGLEQPIKVTLVPEMAPSSVCAARVAAVTGASDWPELLAFRPSRTLRARRRATVRNLAHCSSFQLGDLTRAFEPIPEHRVVTVTTTVRQSRTECGHAEQILDRLRHVVRICGG